MSTKGPIFASTEAREVSIQHRSTELRLQIAVRMLNSVRSSSMLRRSRKNLALRSLRTRLDVKADSDVVLCGRRGAGEVNGEQESKPGA
jgi:hypothetical protein